MKTCSTALAAFAGIAALAVGIDTRTPVDDSYALPFRFTGTIDKLTFKLGPEQLTGTDHKAAAEAAAKATD